MTDKTQLILAWSGGKDSAWTLHALRQRDDVEVVALLTTITADYDRSSMQGVRREVIRAQAAAADLPLIEQDIAARGDNAGYDTAMAHALQRAQTRWPALRTAAFGDLFLQDIRDYRVQRLSAIGWDVMTPLFDADTAALARQMLAGGLRAGLCCVDTTQLDAGFAGRDFDHALLAALPTSIDPCGERGEFHTCVWDGPMFRAPLALQRGQTVLREGRFAYTDWVLSTLARA
ncbi:MJ0570-related uncharacterized domain-containing protein [Pseudoxanthomonas sp. GM95]|uniref:Dph6-related ATP pyrophosphatase n=1 Tax=Pseudoxanthomonas sp. GM95 TaxID=1881043 RepID=UPI0008D879FC|nr:ATP-binding protein [Pseudoxanthomonas sp. GM95]SEM36803.1 MJ0570-related uncharacterized domain-containing protein [Pseudoxanthomonas sp. GM95]